MSVNPYYKEIIRVKYVVQLVECLSNISEALNSIPISHKGMVLPLPCRVIHRQNYTCNPCTQELEVGSEGHCHFQLHSELKASLWYMGSCLKIIKKKEGGMAEKGGKNQAQPLDASLSPNK